MYFTLFYKQVFGINWFSLGLGSILLLFLHISFSNTRRMCHVFISWARLINKEDSQFGVIILTSNFVA